jgi:glycosyltransferase involved in cell wall biosynthesis
MRQVVSTGALTYHANLDAAVFFCKEVWPAIKKKVPNAHFLVTGSYDGVDTSGIRANGVKLTGYVQDINPVVAGSAALVVPLRIGGGTRLKILESMALGTPVISTELGAMGLGVVHNETALLADTPEDFADCTVRLMTDPKLRQRLSVNGKEYVAERFGWDRSVDALESAIEYAIERWHRRN